MALVKELPKGSDVFVEAFARGLAVIRAFGPHRRSLTLSQVAEYAGVTVAGARRLLHTLVSLGYARVEGRRFSLTPAVLEIGYSYLGSLDLADIAPPFLDEFVRDQGEICTVSVLDRIDVVYVARAEMRSPLSHRLLTGERLPAHATSSGQVLLAHLAAADLADYLKQAPFERFTEETLTDARSLRKAIALARGQDHAVAASQLERGVCGVAVPIRDRSGTVVAALTTSLNLAKHPLPTVAERFVPALHRVAGRIGAGLVD